MPSAMFSQISGDAQSPAFSFIQRAQQNSVKTGHNSQLRCYTANTPGRHAVEAYIATAFHDQYAAHIDHFLPVLLTIENGDEIEAALGIRFGENESLFLEHYLDQSISDELAQRDIANEAIVEIGNLVSTRAGCSQLLFILLAELLDHLGRDTAIFTATAQVRQLLEKIGCELIPLCDADGSRLGDQLGQWGHYYETSPRVVASDVAANARLLQRPVLARTLKHHNNDLTRVLAMLMPMEYKAVLA